MAAHPITLIVKGQDTSETQFKVKPSHTVGKIALAYARSKGVAAGTIKLLFEGARLAPDDRTIEEAGLEDGDVIDAFVEQTGGG